MIPIIHFINVTCAHTKVCARCHGHFPKSYPKEVIFLPHKVSYFSCTPCPLNWLFVLQSWAVFLLLWKQQRRQSRGLLKSASNTPGPISLYAPQYYYLPCVHSKWYQSRLPCFSFQRTSKWSRLSADEEDHKSTTGQTNLVSQNNPLQNRTKTGVVYFEARPISSRLQSV